jgi:hypothetical protein
VRQGRAQAPPAIVFPSARDINQKPFPGIHKRLVDYAVPLDGHEPKSPFHLKTAQTNFVAALAQCEAALEIFREQKRGHLVMISSMRAMPSPEFSIRGAV